MAVWLVTGGSGFLGRHVLDALTVDGAGAGGPGRHVFALGRTRAIEGDEVHFIGADLNDPGALRESLQGIEPDFVVHTAGRTRPASDDELYRANFWCTTHLLGALRSIGKPMRVVLTGSAAELGPVDSARLPADEGYPADPVEAYGRSKWLATRSGMAERPPLEVVVGRVFNPIGPGLPATQAFGAFAARLAEPGPDPLDLPVGRLDTRRDFVDARDVARALVALAERGRAGQVYHVGTGTSHAIREGLELLIESSGRAVIPREHPALLRSPGPTDSRAAIGRIREEVGWEPRVGFAESLADLWREASDRQPSKPWRGASVAGRAAWRLPLTA